MTTRALTNSPLAGTAIAAVLALSATPLAAQEAPTPDPVMTTQSAPEAVPPPAAPVPTSEPVIQAVAETVEPAASAEPAAPVAAAAEPRPAPRRTGSPAPAAAAPISTTAAAPVPVLADPVPVTTPVISADLPVAAQPLPPEPAATLNADSPLSDSAAIGLGLLGLAAVGGGGVMITRRRRKGAIAPQPRPVAPPLRAPVAAPAIAAPAPLINRETAPSVTCDRSATRTAAPATAAPAIPPGPLPTGQAAVDLFERIATAAPDAANPFTSTKRRRQRARWLLKQHEYALRRDVNEPFDFRAFPRSASPREVAGRRPVKQPA